MNGDHVWQRRFLINMTNCEAWQYWILTMPWQDVSQQNVFSRKYFGKNSNNTKVFPNSKAICSNVCSSINMFQVSCKDHIEAYSFQGKTYVVDRMLLHKSLQYINQILAGKANGNVFGIFQITFQIYRPQYHHFCIIQTVLTFVF